MTTYTFTIGGTAMPLPDANNPPEMEYFAANAVMRRMWDGALRIQHRASRWRYQARFVALTAAEYTTVWTAYSARIASSGTVVFPDGKTKTMMALPGSWQERHFYHESRSEIRYDVSFIMEEV